MQSQTFQKLNRIVFKILAVLIKSNLIRPFVVEHICSTELIRVNTAYAKNPSLQNAGKLLTI